MDDLINREDAVTLPVMPKRYRKYQTNNLDDAYEQGWEDLQKCIEKLPSAQIERDIPMKPIETTDKAWGIPAKQGVCPKCDYYLGHIAFLGDYKGKRITYCETCGQAIDWGGWDFDD